MRVLLSTYDSRGGVEPLAGLAVRLRELGAEVRVCAPPDCAERLAEAGGPRRGADRRVDSAGRTPLPAELVAFLDAGAPPVYVGFGSVRAPEDIARVAIEAIRAQGRRAPVSRGWAGLALIDDRDGCLAVGEVNQQALCGRPGHRHGTRGSGSGHRVPSAALRTALTPQTRARAAAVAGAIRTDGAAVAATLLAGAVSRERPPVSA